MVTLPGQMGRRCFALLVAALVTSLILGASGCTLLGVLADKMPRPLEGARYKDLQGQSIAVMVWADDFGTRIDWPKIQSDIGQGIQSKLQDSQVHDKVKELEKSTFPYTAESIFRFQEDHPDLAAESITEVAGHLGVTRVIYVEISSFQTRSDAAVELFRGQITGNLKVIAVHNGAGKVVYSEDGIRVVFPSKGPEEGAPDIGDYKTYVETLKSFTTQIANRFIPHSTEDE